MKKIAIMQPYFVPYIGYWQLISSVDTFILYDDVNYIKNGWINRNRILLSEKEHYITIPLFKSSSFKYINEIDMHCDKNYKKKMLKSIFYSYKKSPYFEEIFSTIENIILYESIKITDFLYNHFLLLLNLLDIKTEIVFSSEINKEDDLRGQEKVIDICLKMHGNIYINSIGGMPLYSKHDFSEKGIELKFLKTNDISYKQYDNIFVKNLSIVDVLMFNGISETKNILKNYILI